MGLPWAEGMVSEKATGWGVHAGGFGGLRAELDWCMGYMLQGAEKSHMRGPTAPIPVRVSHRERGDPQGAPHPHRAHTET